MPIELCRVVTTDGLQLDGALHRPAEHVPSTLPVDAFLLVHGTGSNFYAPGILETFGRQAIDAGVPVLRINTRGHDGVCSVPGPRGSVSGGAAYERISDCRFDLAAWLELLTQRGFRRVALVGHSMGGVKAVYSQAHEPHPSVAAVVGISPPRFCHRQLMSHPRADAFRRDYQRAEQLVADGRADELLSVRQPLPFLVTAGGFLAKYGPHDEYDALRDLPRLTCPTLVMLGTETVAASPAFDGLPEQIEELARQHAHISLQLVEGANIHYAVCPETPFDRTAAWLREGERT
jgi:pimeloyl-ACP methyl ester carboxylesterase